MNIEMTFSNQVDKKYDNYEDYYLNLANTIFNYLNLNAYFIFEVDLISLEEIQSLPSQPLIQSVRDSASPCPSFSRTPIWWS